MSEKYKIIALITLGVSAVIYGVSAYVMYLSKFEFVGFEKLLNSIAKKEALTTRIKITNNTDFSVNIKALKIDIYDKNGKNVVSFLPTNLRIKKGINNATVTFESGNVFNLLGDYLNEDYKDYVVGVKGRLYGVFPVYYKGRLNLELEKQKK